MLNVILALPEVLFYIVGIVLMLKLYKYATRDEIDSQLYRREIVKYLENIDAQVSSMMLLVESDEEVSE